MGFTCSDHRHPGSNVPRRTVPPPILMTSACPLSANGRISSGESKLFTSIVATSPLLSGVGFRQLSACVDVDFLPLTTIYLRGPLSITKNSGRLVADPLPERGGAPQLGVWD